MMEEGPTLRENSAGRKGRGVLDDFIARSVLLTGIYFFIGNVFEQTYLREFGIRVGLIDINHLVPKFTDLIVVTYAFALWGIFTRLPDRWYNHLAELANPATWRGKYDLWLRTGGCCIAYILLVIPNLVEISFLGSTPSSRVELAFPTSAFFSRPFTLVWCVAVWLVLVVVYARYSHIRRNQLDELWRKRRSFMRWAFQMGVPIALVFSVVTFGFVVPSNYGVFKSKLDLRRMRDSDVGKVEEMVTSSAVCIPMSDVSTLGSKESSYKYESNRSVNEVHHLGSYAGKELFLIFPSRDSEASLCAVSQEVVQSIEVVYGTDTIWR